MSDTLKSDMGSKGFDRFTWIQCHCKDLRAGLVSCLMPGWRSHYQRFAKEKNAKGAFPAPRLIVGEVLTFAQNSGFAAPLI